MIQITGLVKYYGEGETRFQALQHINLEIASGDFVAIQGKSGAGKSTLLHIIGCLDGYNEGNYLLDGMPIANLKDKELAKIRNKKIGFVLQDFSLISHKSVLFNVMLPLFFNHTPYRVMKAQAEKALQQVEIKEQSKKMVNQLSGGQQQRVAIARAIVNHPSIILADEPTGALDTTTSETIMKVFQNLNDEGLTVIIVTHDDTVADYCRRKIVIQDGKIVSNSDNDIYVNI